MDFTFPEPVITVLYGGVGSERAVSLVSGRNIAGALGEHFPVRLIELTKAALPAGLDPAETVVFPALHGEFGEDGGLQRLLEAEGLAYAGCDAVSSHRCMQKEVVKAIAREAGITTPGGVLAIAGEAIDFAGTIATLGPRLVVKPSDQGSSVGVVFIEGEAELAQWWGSVSSGRWLIEERIDGRELTVGLLQGKALGAVEIISSKGFYDYEAKYTPGFSRYEFPAKVPAAVAEVLKANAVQIFELCGCRDFARVDFILRDETVYLLEINTIPGLTETSLLPKSASCDGYDFIQLARAMVEPARQRFAQARKIALAGKD